MRKNATFPPKHRNTHAPSREQRAKSVHLPDQTHAGTKTSKLFGNIPTDLENIQTIWKTSKYFGNIPHNLETIQINRKYSKIIWKTH